MTLDELLDGLPLEAVGTISPSYPDMRGGSEFGGDFEEMTLDELLGPTSKPAVERVSKQASERAGEHARKPTGTAPRFEEMSLDELLDFDGPQAGEPVPRSGNEAWLDELLVPEPAPPPRSRDRNPSLDHKARAEPAKRPSRIPKRKREEDMTLDELLNELGGLTA